MNKATFLAAVLLLTAGWARGHGPAGLKDQIVDVPDPKLSWVFAGAFDRGDEVFQLHLDYPVEGFAFPVEVLTPHQRGLEGHRPAMAVVGPGLPAPTDELRALLPLDVPDGAGVVLDLNQLSPRPVIFEGVLRRVYWTSTPIAVAVDKGHTEIWVWSPQGTTGKFSVGLGVEEDFGADSVNDLLANWSDYAY